MNNIIVSDKGYLHVSLSRKEFYRSTKNKRESGFSQIIACLNGGEIDYQAFDNQRQDLIDNGFIEVPNPHKLFIQLDYFKESGKWYSSGVVTIDRPVKGEEAKSWYDFTNHVRELQSKCELPGVIKGSRFEVLVYGSEHPAGYPQIFRLEK